MRLLNVCGEPRRVLIVQGDQAILDVDAGAHLLRGADQHLQLCRRMSLKIAFSGVRVGVVEPRDLVAGIPPSVSSLVNAARELNPRLLCDCSPNPRL